MILTHKDFEIGEVHAATIERIKEYIRETIKNRKLEGSELYVKITAEETLPSILRKTTKSLRMAVKTACEYCDDIRYFEYSISGMQYDSEKRVYRNSLLIGFDEFKED